MTEPQKILGVILAGGAATRMFPEWPAGGDKGLADLGGQPMLAHVIARFRPQVQHLILNANGDATRFQSFGLDVVADDPNAAARGPLSGLVTAMRWAAARHGQFDYVATVTTDCPFIPLDLVVRLSAQSNGAPVLAASDGARHPAIGLWPVSAVDDVQKAASGGDWSLGRLVDSLNGLAVDFPLCKVGDQSIDPFFNANTKDDVIAARALLAQMSPGGFMSQSFTTPMIGIAGWSNAGKTTLIEKLAQHFSARGLRVATIKHTHHKFEIDTPGSDTARHRAAGAAETAIVSGSRVAVIEEIETRGEPSLAEVAARLKPADIIFVEGYKSAAIPKIEVRRATAAAEKMLAANDSLVVAIAADHDVDGHGKPVFALDDVAGIAGVIEKAVGPFERLVKRA